MISVLPGHPAKSPQQSREGAQRLCRRPRSDDDREPPPIREAHID